MTVKFPGIFFPPRPFGEHYWLRSYPICHEIMCTRCLYLKFPKLICIDGCKFRGNFSPPQPLGECYWLRRYPPRRNNVIFAPDVYGTLVFLLSAELFLVHVSPLSLQHLPPRTDRSWTDHLLLPLHNHLDFFQGGQILFPVLLVWSAGHVAGWVRPVYSPWCTYEYV